MKDNKENEAKNIDNKEKEAENVPVTWGNTPYGRATEFSPIVRVFPKIKRNAVCPFSGKKFKNCCGVNGQDYCNRAKENLEKYLTDLKNKKATIEQINNIPQDDKSN